MYCNPTHTFPSLVRKGWTSLKNHSSSCKLWMILLKLLHIWCDFIWRTSLLRRYKSAWHLIQLNYLLMLWNCVLLTLTKLRQKNRKVLMSHAILVLASWHTLHSTWRNFLLKNEWILLLLYHCTYFITILLQNKRQESLLYLSDYLSHC